MKDLTLDSLSLKKGMKSISPVNCRKTLRESWERSIVQNTLAEFGLADADFENPDGSAVVIDLDYTGKKRPEKSVAGPIYRIKERGEIELKSGVKPVRFK